MLCQRLANSAISEIIECIKVSRRDSQTCLIPGMLAADGRCKSLDASADGYVRAEAVGTVLMRVVSTIDKRALAEESIPHALILGAAVNQDGRSSSLTAPNGPAQQALIRSAIESAQLPPSKVFALSSPLSFKPPSLAHPIAILPYWALSHGHSGNVLFK